jgi:hypothetical protein
VHSWKTRALSGFKAAEASQNYAKASLNSGHKKIPAFPKTILDLSNMRRIVGSSAHRALLFGNEFELRKPSETFSLPMLVNRNYVLGP